MSLLLPFLSGFLAAVIGIFPPGLINMTAAKVSVTDGRKRAMVFVLGALLIILIQTYISVLFAQYINHHSDVIILLREKMFNQSVYITKNVRNWINHYKMTPLHRSKLTP